jgi:hypothetical protein
MTRMITGDHWLVVGNNPDVLIDAEGNIVFRTAQGLLKEVWNTGLDVSTYFP